MFSRRSLFQDTALLSALAALVREEGFAQAPDQSPKVADFWDAYFDEAQRDPNQVSRGSTDSSLIEPSKRVQLIQATDDGLIYPDGIDNTKLLAESEVVVTLNPAHFRPAPDDHRAISRTKGCQIRLDCIQTRPIMNLLAPMAWAGLAAWSLDKTTYTSTKVVNSSGAAVIDPTTKQQKISMKASAPSPPELKDLDFKDPNAPNAPQHNQVVLPGGSGRMALNVRGVSTNQRLQTVLDKTVSYSSIIAPFFGFAALALPALKVFTTLLGAVFNHETVIMNSMPVQILATQDAWKGPHDSSAVKIVAGDFIAVPINQAAILKDSMEKLRIVNGWLVHQDSSKNLPPEQRAQDARVPAITYMSIALTVQTLADAQKAKATGG
jgi:hypothetical protein